MLPGEPPVPVLDGHGAVASEPTTFSTWTTATLMDNDAAQFWPAFERANALLLSLVAQDFITERAHETARIASRRRQSSFAFTEGLRRAGAVLRKDIFSGEIGIADDPLFAAASAVAARQKIILKRIARAAIASPEEYLDAICLASRINLRQVTLEHGLVSSRQRAPGGVC